MRVIGFLFGILSWVIIMLGFIWIIKIIWVLFGILMVFLDILFFKCFFLGLVVFVFVL